MNDEIRNKIKDLAHHTREDIGIAEESVKINFIVRLLEYLGHRRIDFEYKYTDIILKKGLPHSSSVIIETKSYEKKLINELNQLERYCHEVQPLFGIIANGTDIMIFSYFWRYRPFQKRMIYHISREQLSDDNTINDLERILSRYNLKDGSARKNVIEREKEIENAENEIKEIKTNLAKEEKAIEFKIQELTSESQKIMKEIEELKTEKDKLTVDKETKINNIWEKFRIYPIREEIIPTAPRSVRRLSGDSPNSGRHRRLGRRGYENLKDYLLPVIKLINNGVEYKDAFHKIEEKLGVKYNTVSAQCTRQLGISTEQFIEYVRSGEIIRLLKKKFPERSKIIEQELRS